MHPFSSSTNTYLPFTPGWPRLPVISRRPCGSLLYMLCDASLVLFLSGMAHLAVFAAPVVAANITWISPLRGDVYGSGDTIVGQWDTEEPLVSPAVRLCMHNSGGGTGAAHAGTGGAGGSGGGASAGAGAGKNKRAAGSGGSCGTAAYPNVEQSQSDGSYVIHVVLPNVTTTSQCYLKMTDESGQSFASPTFSYQPSANDDPANPDVSAKEAQPSPDSATLAPSSAPNTVPQPSSTAQRAPSLEESRMPTPTAAYAVPLSLVGTVLVCAGGLALRQRRKLSAERRKERDALETRQTLSRVPALDLVGLGFTHLGRAPARAPAPPFRNAPSASLERQDTILSSSVSLSRWRREVSLHHPHSHPQPPPADDETYVARSEDGDDGRSVASRGYAPRPRRATREPFYTVGASRARRPTVGTASMFRQSPIGLHGGGPGDSDAACRRGESRYATYGRRRHPIAADDEDDEDWGRLKRRPALAPSEDMDRIKVESYHNASVNNGVFSHYLSDLSPIPLSPAQPSQGPSAGVSQPERLHVRRYAQDATQDVVRPRVEERNLYDVVARKISRDEYV